MNVKKIEIFFEVPEISDRKHYTFFSAVISPRTAAVNF
jgi:hypothetical protein